MVLVRRLVQAAPAGKEGVAEAAARAAVQRTVVWAFGAVVWANGANFMNISTGMSRHERRASPKGCVAQSSPYDGRPETGWQAGKRLLPCGGMMNIVAEDKALPVRRCRGVGGTSGADAATARWRHDRTGVSVRLSHARTGGRTRGWRLLTVPGSPPKKTCGQCLQTFMEIPWP